MWIFSVRPPCLMLTACETLACKIRFRSRPLDGLNLCGASSLAIVTPPLTRMWFSRSSTLRRARQRRIGVVRSPSVACLSRGMSCTLVICFAACSTKMGPQNVPCGACSCSVSSCRRSFRSRFSKNLQKRIFVFHCPSAVHCVPLLTLCLLKVTHQKSKRSLIQAIPGGSHSFAAKGKGAFTLASKDTTMGCLV